MAKIYYSIKDWISQYPVVYNNLKYIGVLLLAYVSYFVTKKIVFKLIRKFTAKTKTSIDDIVFNEKVIKYLSFVVPLYILNIFAHLGESFQTFIQHTTTALIIMFVLLAIGNLITSFTEYYEKSEKFSRQPIKGYAQVAKIILYIFGALFIVGIFTNEKPFVILTGLGALSAVLILVFKDTILGFVASIQISSYELIKIGDWIEIPSFGADGEVVDIALHTIKIQNWDKTFTLIPTYKLIENSFKNWRGMEQSGSRRIKRHIYIDMTSIKFIDDDIKKSLANSEFIDKKCKSILKEKINSSGNELTNLGLFMHYISIYIGSREDIRNDFVNIVRQQQSTTEGLPVEIYAFCNKINLVDYEKTQGEIFEHIYASVPLFGLSIFQKVSGENIENAFKSYNR